MRWWRELVAHINTPRCRVCGCRQDRPEPVCRGLHVIGFQHIWEETVPSDDPGRPPKGPGSGGRRDPIEIRIIVSNATAKELADADDDDD